MSGFKKKMLRKFKFLKEGVISSKTSLEFTTEIEGGVGGGF